jgi:thymidylate synthase (FAD)
MQATGLIDVEYYHHVGGDETTVDAARVSFKRRADQFSDERNHKLIGFLAREHHRSPFNHAFLTVVVTAPIFVARQLVKHEYMPWNEVSRRYVRDDPEYFQLDWRWAAQSKKQGSGDRVCNEALRRKMDAVYSRVLDACDQGYRELLDLGVCEEQARAVLPLSTQTSWFWSGTLGAFAKMCALRLDPHAQAEAREVANQIDAIATELWPVSWESWKTFMGNA